MTKITIVSPIQGVSERRNYIHLPQIRYARVHGNALLQENDQNCFLGYSHT